MVLLLLSAKGSSDVESCKYPVLSISVSRRVGVSKLDKVL